MSSNLRCPSCDREVLTPVCSTIPSEEIMLDLVRFQAPSFQIWVCKTCGLCFKDKTLSDSELIDYYRSVDFRKWEGEGSFPTEQAVLSLLRRLPRNACVLDYGCATGRMCALLVSEYRCYGYEPNPDSAKIAAERGLRILNDEELSSKIISFDAIVLMDVFEHLRSPTRRLKELFNLLNEGGSLIIATGNFDSRAFRSDPANFWYLRLAEHLCALSRKYVEYLCRELPADLAHWQEMSHYTTPLIGVLTQYAQWFSFQQFRKNTGLSRWILPWIFGMRRAKNWTKAPALSCTRDHVVVELRKSGATNLTGSVEREAGARSQGGAPIGSPVSGATGLARQESIEFNVLLRVL